jgi:putative sigma-54 modulation protein
MELQITGTNTEISPASQQYVEKKLSKLNKHLPDIIDIKVEISEEKTKAPEQHFLVRVTVSSGVGGVFHGEERAEELFKAVDKVADIMTRQLERHKGKLYDRGRGNPLARGKAGAEVPAGVAKPVKTERRVIEAMSPDEAVEKMEEQGSDFFIFADAGDGNMRVVYRRSDDSYGLIRPEFE